MIFFQTSLEDITCYSNNKSFVDNFNNSTVKAILKYRNHPSIVAIRNQCKNRDSSSFTEVDKKEFEHLILNQDVNKVSQSCDIPLKIVKKNTDVFSNFLCANFSSSVKSGKFQKNLKLADITPLHEKGKKDIKSNYRPVSILPNFSKILENCVFTQMLQFF